MENFVNKRRQKGYDSSNDPDSQMKTRPKIGRVVEDFGSSFASSSRPKKPSRSGSVLSTSSYRGRSKSGFEDDSGDESPSEDELLLSDGHLPEEKQEEKRMKHWESAVLGEQKIVENKYGKFARIGKTKSGESSTPNTSTSNVLKENSPAPHISRSRDVSSSIPLSPKSANTRPKPKPHTNSSSLEKPTKRKAAEKPPPHTSRLPEFDSRSAKTATSGRSAPSEDKHAKGKAAKAKRRQQVLDSDDDDDVEIAEKDGPKAFPMSPPRRGSYSDSEPRRPKAFPMSSPSTPPRTTKDKPAAFPDLSPLRVDDGDQGTSSGRGRRKPAPFPMDDSFSTPRAGPSGSQAKRGSSLSPDGSEDRRKKKRAQNEPPPSSFPTLTNDSDEEDEELRSFSVDPKTLCPYCDDPLPKSPSPLLLRLLEDIASKSVRAPRPRNPLGRKAALGVFVSVCQRHRFESEVLPEAEKKGWPKSIDWGSIESRVKNMREDLEALLNNDRPKQYDPDMWDDDDNMSLDSLDLDKTVRDLSVFWREAVKEVKEKGTRVAGNVKNQFANFEKTQPGYYGELGSVIIHQTLFEMFPPETTNEESNNFAPLNLKSFIERVLVPETSARLIMEDKGLQGISGMKEAVKILRESSSYGVAMFPEDGGEWGDGSKKGLKKKKGKEGGDDLDVADRMVREKARKRRAELAVEDKVDKVLIAQEKEGEEMKEKGKGKGKEKGGWYDDEAASATANEKPRPKPRPKPRLLAKNKSTGSLRSDDDMQAGMSDFQSDNEPSHGIDFMAMDTEGRSAASPDPWKVNNADAPEVDDDFEAFWNDIETGSKRSDALSANPSFTSGGKSPIHDSTLSRKSKSRFSTKSKTDSRTTSRAATIGSDTDDFGMSDNAMEISSESDAASVKSVKSAMSAGSSASIRSTRAQVGVKLRTSREPKGSRAASRASSVEEIDPPVAVSSSRPQPRPKAKPRAVAVKDDDADVTPKASKFRPSTGVPLRPLDRARQMLRKPSKDEEEISKNKKKQGQSEWVTSMRANGSKYSYGETDEELDQRMIPEPATSPARSDPGWLLDDSQEMIT